MEIKINDAAITHTADIGTETVKVGESITPVSGERQENAPTRGMRESFNELSSFTKRFSEQLNADIQRPSDLSNVMHAKDEEICSSYSEAK